MLRSHGHIIHEKYYALSGDWARFDHLLCLRSTASTLLPGDDHLSEQERLYKSYALARFEQPMMRSSVKEAWRSGSVVTSGSEDREFEPHSGSDEVTLFLWSAYHHYGDSYDGGSYQSIGLSA